MEDLEPPNKKRKPDGGGVPSTENHLTNGDSVKLGDTAPSRAQSHLQFNTSGLERLRQLTKACQKKNSLPAAKPNGSKLQLSTGAKKEITPEKNSSSKEPNSPDFIISSAGSSPARSPQSMNFNVLSTPPRSSRPNEMASSINETAELDSNDLQKACTSLVKRFEESSNKTLSNGVCSDSRTSESGFSSVEVLEEGDQARPLDSTVKAPHVNGTIGPSVGNKDHADVSTKERNSPALSDLVHSVTASQSERFNFNSDEFRQMLKKMIEERMTQIERSIGHDKPNDKLVDRLVSLEKENKALKEYAKRVEDSVKDLLNAEKEKAKQKVTQAVQTQDPNWFNPLLRPKTVASTSSSVSVTATRPSFVGVNVMTTPTPRLTSTVAPLPGHTMPSRLEGVSQSSPVNFRHAAQRQQPEALHPRFPVSSNTPPHAQSSVGTGATYAPNYDPGTAARPTPSQPAMLRAAAPTPNFSPSAHPRFNGVRATPPTVQPPRPMPRVQGPVTSLAAGRNVALAPNRPLPTVTVHPQTSSSSTSVRVPQESPAYGYSTQNAYHNGQPRPRFSVAPQMSQRPQQRPQISHGGPSQISPGPRPASYPQSPMQPSPPHHMLQQPLRPEHQPASRPHHPVPIRPSAPVQMHSPSHTMNQLGATQTQQQQPGMVHYQQVAGPPRQVASAQPSVPQPGFTQLPIRSPQPAASGLPPGAGQPPHNPSPTLRGKEPPPKPSVSIAVVTSGIVLSWNMPLEEKHAPVLNYQLFALQDGGNAENLHPWKKIGVVKALPLPMACTLTQFLPGNKYHFAVRGTDELGRLGPLSDTCTITLNKSSPNYGQ